MKIECEIADINRDEIIEAMARQLLGEWVDYNDETGPGRELRATALGKQMKVFLGEKIGDLAESLVREKFDHVVADRIAATVDEVIVEGWQQTNQYGEARGPKVDLKARITDVMLKPSDHYDRMSPIDKQVKAAVERTIATEFKETIDKAKTALREQLETAVSGTFTAAVKSAMGIK